MTRVDGKCQSCLRVRALAELLAVDDNLTHRRAFVCRPRLSAACIRAVGSRDRFQISDAAPSDA